MKSRLKNWRKNKMVRTKRTIKYIQKHYPNTTYMPIWLYKNNTLREKFNDIEEVLENVSYKVEKVVHDKIVDDINLYV